MTRRRGPARLRDYLEHIAQAVANVAEYTQELEKASYLADRKTQDAVVRNLEVIGEACNNVATQHPQFAAAHPEVPWGIAYEMRNALAHGYFKVDHEIVWTTIHADLPSLAANILDILDSLPPAET
jgi:uncharacterized protein with HEPN domain